ncbi:MAG: DUF4172 domain-containing protein [Nitrospira sp.]|nr:DUF4172 domain-containing protein [Nitrospira sp.]
MTYIHERSDWPNFTWDQEKLASKLAAVRHRQGRLIGRMEAIGFPLRKEAVLETLTLDVVKSSEIEGAVLNPEQVRSSIARRLGMDIAGAIPADRHVEGVVEMMLDATQHFDQPLTPERLFGGMRPCFRQDAAAFIKSSSAPGATIPQARCRLFRDLWAVRKCISRRPRLNA